MIEGEEEKTSNIVRPKQFKSASRLDPQVEAKLHSMARLSPGRRPNLTAVAIFIILGTVALLGSALEPTKSDEMTWHSGLLMLAGGLCFGIAGVYRFAKAFWK